jgi:DNA primase
VMIVEGYFDVVRLVSAGFEWVVAPLGTALTEDQAALLPRYARQAFLLYDNDRAGLKATFRSGDQLLRQHMSVQVVTLPEGEDPDSFVDKFGAEKLTEQLAGAVDVFERKLNELQRNGYFADLHRKRVAIDKLLPTLRATADSVTREIYLSRASEVSGVRTDVLEREVNQMSTLVASTVRTPSVPPAPLTDDRLGLDQRLEQQRFLQDEDFEIERPLVRILLHRRSLLEQTAERIGPEELRDPALQDIYRVLLSVPVEESMEVVASRLQAGSAHCFAQLQRHPIGDGEQVEAQIEGSIANIRSAALKREMAKAQDKLRIASPEEQDQILSEKVRLRNQKNAVLADRPTASSARKS